MTTGEAAAILGVTPGAVRQAIARGRLEATKTGRDWLIRPQALEAYRTAVLGRPGRPGGQA